MPKFSVIIPVYNVAPYLRECLDSVLEAEKRLGEKIEIICIDDGSTDGSARILDEYAKCATVIHQENAGVGAARNVGLDRATGEWIWCVDADDIIHPDSLRYLSGELDRRAERPTAIFVGLSHDLNNIKPLSNSPAMDFEINKQSQDRVWRTPAYTLFRRDLLQGLRFTKYKIAEDVIFVLNYFVRTPRGWIEVSDALYYYRQRTGSATTYKPDMEILAPSFDIESRLTDLLMQVLKPYGCHISWFGSGIYTTPKWSLFLVPVREARPFVPAYLKNFWKYNAWVPFSASQRVAVRIFSWFPHPFVGRVVIYYREMGWRCLRRLIHGRA